MAANRRFRRPGAQLKPPDGRIRQSQVVTTFGPGSMLDLVDDAVLIGGLDFWRMPNDGERVDEPRLLEAIEHLFHARKWPLNKEAPFRRPPAGDEREPSDASGIQVLEFPTWVVCQNPRCRALVRASSLERVRGKVRHRCSGGDGSTERCIPVRFVAACTRGHLSDVNWPRWTHEGNACAGPQLKLVEGPSGDFSEIEIACTACGKKRKLIEMTVKDRQDDCFGQRPWLGSEGNETGCTEKQRLLVRTASNGYFGQTMSVITIPEPETLRRRVQSVWETLEHATPQLLGAFRVLPKVKAALGSASDEQVMEAIEAERHRTPELMPEVRTAEWLQFTHQPLEKPGEMPIDRTDPFWARKIARPKGLPPEIGGVIVARRLREVQALVGFTRIDASTTDLQGRLDLDVKLAPLTLQRDWVPVTEVKGEGVLLTLDEARLHAWEKSEPVLKRTETLRRAYESWVKVSKSKLEFPGARFYLLHSLSHLLMTEVSLDCGYPASSIHERLYCAPHEDANPMAGLLLMTGTNGAEGTLGGLVEEGARLGRHLKRAWKNAQLCSNDPVCAKHEPTQQDDRFLEGAACHGCLFLPECSCERFNQFLDRALVVPTLGLEDVAFLRTSWT